MLRKADWQAPIGVQAFFTLRTGGVSTGSYASLNFGTHVGDTATAVEENRSRLSRHLSRLQPPARLQTSNTGSEVVLHWLDQVHGDLVVEPDANPISQTADAFYTKQKRQVLAIMSADCLPVFFASADGREIAIAHAGWRGLAAGVLEATLAKFDAEPSEIMAAFGPAIGPEAFEVGDDVRSAFLQAHPEASSAFKSRSEYAQDSRYLCNLYQLAEQTLRRAGVERVSGGADCTFTNSTDFFSYRRDGVCGRMASIIWLD